MAKVIVVTSGKGGVGKTTTAINLAAAMNYFNEDVLIIDANISTPNVGIHFGTPEVPVNLNHILTGKATPEEAVYEHESGVKIMPASLSIRELKKMEPDKLKEFKSEFKKLGNTIIVDCAAGLGDEALAAVKMADEIVVVTNPEMPAITDALKTIKMAESLRKNVKGVIVTRVKRNEYEMQPEAVKEMLEVDILGSIPEDIVLQEALSLKNAVVHTHPKSRPARAYKEIASMLLEVAYDSDADKETFWERFRKRFGVK